MSRTKIKQTFDVKTVDTPSDLVAVNQVESKVPDQVLTKEEVTALTYHENVIEKGLETFIEVGQSLQYIRDNRLYRAEYSNFNDYIQERWSKKRNWADSLIKAVNVNETLNSLHVEALPQTESQARPLAKLKDNPELMAQVWEEAVAEAKKQFEAGLKKTDQPTHKEVEAKVKEYEAQIEALKNKQTSLLDDLEKEKRNTEWQGNVIREFNLKGDQRVQQLEETVKNQQKQIKELNSAVSVKENELQSLENDKLELDLKQRELDDLIAKEANVIAQETLEQERQVLLKKEADLLKKETQVKDELKAVQNLKQTAIKQKENFNAIQEWVNNFQLTNEFLAEATNELKKYKNKLQKNPNLSELEDVDRLKVEEKIKNLIVDFNDNLHNLGGAINYLNGAVVKFNNSALRVIDAEVTDDD